MRKTLLFAIVILVAGCKKDRPAGGPSKPVDKAKLEAITKLPFGDADIKVFKLDADATSFTITPKLAGDAPQRRARLSVSRCMNCVPMDKAQWEARKSELKLLVPQEVRDKPDTIYEIGEATIAGHKVITTYWAGVAVEPGPSGPTTTNAHAYTINWNDGVNQIHDIVYDASLPASTSVEQVVTVVPRAELEELGASTFTKAIAALEGN